MTFLSAVVYVCLLFVFWRTDLHFKFTKWLFAIFSLIAFSVVFCLLFKVVFLDTPPASLVQNKDIFYHDEAFAANDSELFCQSRNYHNDQQGLATFSLKTFQPEAFYPLGTEKDYCSIQHIATDGHSLAFILEYKNPVPGHYHSRDICFLDHGKLRRFPHHGTDEELAACVYWDPAQKLFADCSFNDKFDSIPCTVKRSFYEPVNFSVVKTDSFNYFQGKHRNIMVSLFQNSDHLFGTFLGDSVGDHVTKEILFTGGKMRFNDSAAGRLIPPMSDQGFFVELDVHHKTEKGFFSASGIQPVAMPPDFDSDSLSGSSEGYDFLDPAGYLRPCVLYESKNKERKRIRLHAITVDLTDSTAYFSNSARSTRGMAELPPNFYVGNIFEAGGRIVFLEWSFREYMVFDINTFERIDKISYTQKVRRAVFNGREHPYGFKFSLALTLLFFPLGILWWVLFRKKEDEDTRLTVQRYWLLYLAPGLFAATELFLFFHPFK